MKNNISWGFFPPFYRRFNSVCVCVSGVMKPPLIRPQPSPDRTPGSTDHVVAQSPRRRLTRRREEVSRRQRSTFGWFGLLVKRARDRGPQWLQAFLRSHSRCPCLCVRVCVSVQYVQGCILSTKQKNSETTHEPKTCLKRKIPVIFVFLMENSEPSGGNHVYTSNAFL